MLVSYEPFVLRTMKMLFIAFSLEFSMIFN